ncbi:MAG: DUF305 domain-containing protein [Gemmatimonadaceae bacterium]
MTRSLAAIPIAVAITACGGHTGAMRSTPTPAAASRPAQGEAAAVARAEADSIRNPYTAADIHFMQGMIGHHSQAIAMAAWAPTHGASASLRTLAARITNAQQDEIATMQTWLSDRHQTVPAAGPMKMMVNGKEQEMLMPGMLNAAQMHQLDLARGPDFDRLFLTDMIQHHRGAVSMVKDLFGTYGAGQDELIFKFASDVNVDQTTEIARMERMLNAFALEKNAQ